MTIAKISLDCTLHKWSSFLVKYAQKPVPSNHRAIQCDICDIWVTLNVTRLIHKHITY